MMQAYRITLTGKMPLLMHADNIEWADVMEQWKANPNSKKIGKAGDDRTPAFRWIGCLYHDGTTIGMPNDNLMRCMMEGGALVPVPGATRKTFKSQTQSGMLVEGSHWPLRVQGKEIAIAPILTLQDEASFAEHKRVAREYGFDLYVKRARIGQSKHVRVRPRFDEWAVEGLVRVWDEQITSDVLTQIITQAGYYKGLGDWRPGGKTPGPFGMFTATVRAA